MAPSTHETPVSAVNCRVPDCKKQQIGGYKTKNGLANHVKRWHQAAKDVLSPMAETARALFQNDEEVQPSTQGNSAGAVNSPKVVSEGRFQCGLCEEEYTSTDNMRNHMTKHHQGGVYEQDDDITDDGNDDDDVTDKEVGEITEDEVVNNQPNSNVELNNMLTVDKIVDIFVDNAFREMHPDEVTTGQKCHDDDEDRKISDLMKVVEEKDAKIVEKTALAAGLHMKIKHMTSELETLKHDANMRQQVEDDQIKQLEMSK